MALNAQALTLWATARDEMGLASGSNTPSAAVQATVERMINSASNLMARFCNRQFERGSAIAERVKGMGGTRIYLKRTPIVSIASIQLIDSAGAAYQTLDPTEYTIENANTGAVIRYQGWPWVAEFADDISGARLQGTELPSVLVTYTGGWVTPAQDGTGSPALVRDLPSELEEACIIAVTSMYRHKGQDRESESINVDDGPTVNYRDADRAGGNVLPKETREICKAFRRSF